MTTKTYRARRCIKCNKKATHVDASAFYRGGVVHYCAACATASGRKSIKTIEAYWPWLRDTLMAHAVR